MPPDAGSEDILEVAARVGKALELVGARLSKELLEKAMSQPPLGR